VVGAGLGGLRTVEQLRSRGFAGRLTLAGAERHPPYDRPPLSKPILNGTWEPARAALREPAALAELDVDLRLGVRATGLTGTTGTTGPTVELDDGTTLPGDALVIATGVTPVRLPGQPAGVPTLRTLDDAVALRAALTSIRSLLVVGAGFIGAEVACAARDLGVSVTVLEALPVPCERGLGREVGGLAGRLFADAGIDLRCDTRIAGFDGDHAVVLADGTRLSADLVLVGVGARPDTGWLEAAGLPVENGGLACDARGRVRGVHGVWALGDVAAWWDPARGRRHRSEHWTSTGDQAAAVGCDILGAELPPPSVPYVWSDQFGLKIQAFGHPDLADEVVALHGDGLAGGPVKGTVAGYFAGGVLIGAVGFGAPAKVFRCRAQIAAGARRDDVLPVTSRP
jgi:NADPH-dependent 2,4-dienoyl-CoA reductase/sulfur reductase-like enzyme